MERKEKYWICDDCAKKQKLIPFKTGNTVIMGLCGWCERPDDAFLTPMRDFRNESRSEIRRKEIMKEDDTSAIDTGISVIEAAVDIIDAFSGSDSSSDSGGDWSGGGGDFSGGGASGDW